MQGYSAMIEDALENGDMSYGELDAETMLKVAMDSMGIDEGELVEKVMRGIFNVARAGLTTCTLSSILGDESNLSNLLAEKIITPHLIEASFSIERSINGYRISW